MSDLFFIVLTVVFFTITVGLVHAFDRLLRRHS